MSPNEYQIPPGLREVLGRSQVIGTEGRARRDQVDGHLPYLGGDVEMEPVELSERPVLDPLDEVDELGLAGDGSRPGRFRVAR